VIGGSGIRCTPSPIGRTNRKIIEPTPRIRRFMLRSGVACSRGGECLPREPLSPAAHHAIFFDSAMLAETGNRVSCPGAGASKRLRPHLPVARTTVLIVFPDDAAIIDTDLPSPLATVRMVVQGVGGSIRHPIWAHGAKCAFLNFTMLANFFPFSRSMLMDG
jgi:hypothetical protein